MVKALGQENLGDDLPLGGFFDMSTDLLISSYEELEKIASSNIKYSEENTPEHYEEDWKELETDLEYDEPGEAYKIRNISYDELYDKADVEKWTNKTNKMKFVDIYNKI